MTRKKFRARIRC